MRLILSFYVIAGLVLVVTTTTTDQPPGCECTAGQCCAGDGAADCYVLEAHLSLTNFGTLEEFCAPYIAGTADNATTICDAILADTRFSDRFVDRGEFSLAIYAENGATCSELAEGPGCPAPNNLTKSLKAWASGSASGTSCFQINTVLEGGMALLTSGGCADQQGVLDVLDGTVAPDTVDDLETCPASASFTFTDATANGPDMKRWMCSDVDDDGAPIRILYINLGNLPCGGSQLPSPPPPSPGGSSTAPPPLGMAGWALLAATAAATALSICTGLP